MRFSLIVAALLPVAWAAPFNTFEERTAATVLADLKTLTADGVKLNTTLNAFGDDEAPSTAQILALQDENTATNKALKAATTAAKNSDAFTKAQSKKIATYVAGTLAPATISTIQNFVDHYPGLKSAGVAGIVHSSLVAQKKLVQKQTKAVTAKLHAPYKAQAPAVNKQILAAYTAAINTFAS
jgi:hypothetical protein